MPSSGLVGIDWIAEDVTVRSFDGHGQAHIKVRGDKLTLSRSAETPVNLHVETTRRNLEVTGNVGPESTLTVDGSDLRNLAVGAEFRELTLIRSASQHKVVTHSTVMQRVNLPKGHHTLESSHQLADGLRIRVQGGGSARLDGTAPVASLEVLNGEPLTVTLPASDRAEFITSGPLTLTGNLGERCAIVAAQLQCPPLKYATIAVAGQVVIKGDFVGGRANVAGGMRVHGSVDSAAVTCENPSGPALQVGGSGDHPVLEYIMRDASDDAIEWPTMDDDAGTVQDSKIACPAGQAISAVNIRTTELKTRGPVYVRSHLDIYRVLTATQVVSDTVQLHANAEVDLQQLECRHLYGDGHLKVDEGLVAKIVGEEGGELTVSAAKIDAGRPNGHVTLRARRELTATGAATSEEIAEAEASGMLLVTGTLDVKASGLVRVGAGSVRTVTLIGGFRASLDNVVVERLQVRSRSGRIAIGEDALVESGRVSGKLQVISECVINPWLEVQDEEPASGSSPHFANLPVLGFDSQGPTDDLRGRGFVVSIAPSTVILLAVRPQREPAGFRLGVSTGKQPTVTPTSSSGRLRQRKEVDGQGWDLTAFGGGGEPSIRFFAPKRSTIPRCPHLTIKRHVAVSLDGRLRGLLALQQPSLSLVSYESAVYSAAGDLRLGSQFVGSLHGKVSGDGGRSGKALLRIRGLQRPDEQRQYMGKLLDVDVTQLPFTDLENLGFIGALEPNPASLHHFTKKSPDKMGTSDLRAFRRERAEIANRIVAAMESSAVSGRSMAAAKWASARLHHLAMPKGSEWFLRWFHWSAGYSQRPNFAFATFLMAVAFIVLLGLCFGAKENAGVWDVIEVTVAMPFNLVRLETQPFRVFKSPLANLGAAATVGLPFAYFIVALKNFLATPSGSL